VGINDGEELDEDAEKFETTLIAITEERGDEELGVCCLLGVAMLLECRD